MPSSKRHCVQFYCLLLSVVPLLSSQFLAAQPASDCSNSQSNLSYWDGIYTNQSQAAGNADALAQSLLPCLGSENPALRDTYGYGLFTHWLRSDLLSQEVKQPLTAQLQTNLASDQVLLRSFSALILSEILRADGLTTFLTSAQRDTLLQHSSRALLAEDDYRGLDAQLGWVHPVAHLADIHWRIALHPQLTQEQATESLAAIYPKAVTLDASYVFNESDRMARVVAILIRRQALGTEQFATWLAQFAERRDGSSWSSAFASPAGMTELHNSKAFIRALAEQLATSELPEAIDSQLHELLEIFRQLV